MTFMVRSKFKGYEFAQTFVEDAKKVEEEGRKRVEAESQMYKKLEQSLGEVESKEVKSSATDYNKWASLEQKIMLEEKMEEEKKKAEEEMSKRQMASMGCAHDHTKERLLYEKSSVEKIKAAERFRLEGNAAYKIGNFGLAAMNYRKALLQFDYCFPDEKEELALVDKIKLPCHLNLAACKIHQQDWDEVLTQCRMALEMDPKNSKALYRRGFTYLKLDDYESARKDLERARQLEPQNSSVLDAIKSLNCEVAKYQQRNRQVCRAMLNCEGNKDKSVQPVDGNENTVTHDASTYEVKGEEATKRLESRGSEPLVVVGESQSCAVACELDNKLGQLNGKNEVLRSKETTQQSQTLPQDESGGPCVIEQDLGNNCRYDQKKTGYECEGIVRCNGVKSEAVKQIEKAETLDDGQRILDAKRSDINISHGDPSVSSQSKRACASSTRKDDNGDSCCNIFDTGKSEKGLSFKENHYPENVKCHGDLKSNNLMHGTKKEAKIDKKRKIDNLAAGSLILSNKPISSEARWQITLATVLVTACILFYVSYFIVSHRNLSLWLMGGKLKDMVPSFWRSAKFQNIDTGTWIATSVGVLSAVSAALAILTALFYPSTRKRRKPHLLSSSGISNRVSSFQVVNEGR